MSEIWIKVKYNAIFSIEELIRNNSNMENSAIQCLLAQAPFIIHSFERLWHYFLFILAIIINLTNLKMLDKRTYNRHSTSRTIRYGWCRDITRFIVIKNHRSCVILKTQFIFLHQRNIAKES